METSVRQRSSTDKEGKVITLIFSPDEDKDRLYRFPRDTSCKDVISKWTKDCSPSYTVLLFSDDSDQPLDDATLLESLSCAPEAQVSLHAIPAMFSVCVGLLDGSPTPQKLEVSPVDLPEQLMPKISKLLHLPSDQKFRLRIDHRVLEAQKAIWRQEVVADSLLSIELEFSGIIHDRHTGEHVRDFSVFASDPASALKCPPYLAVQRFWMKDRLLPSQGTIAEVFAGAEAPFNLELQLERQQSVRWMRGLEIAELRDLWPSRRLPPPPKPSDFLQFDKKPLDLVRTVAQLRLPHDALLQCRSITALLRIAPRRFAVKTLTAAAAAADLAPRHFVRPDARIAAAYRPAALLADRVAAALFVAKPSISVMVQLSHKHSERLEVRKGVARFSDILIPLREHLSLVERRTVAFACVGCGRKLMREEEESQEVPSNCCKKESLLLRVVRRSRKRGTQATMVKRTAEKNCPAMKIHTEEISLQTTPEPYSSRTTQTSTCVFVDGPQPQDAVPPPLAAGSDASDKAPPDGHEHVPFFVCNWARIGRHSRDFRCSLLLPPDPKVGDVLSALEAELELPPGRVRLKQWQAKTPDDRPLTWVCRVAGYPGDEYGDSNGIIFRRKDVVGDVGVELGNGDPFPIVPGRRNIVVVIQN